MTRELDIQYLESKVLTASPSQLHLLLIEGAIRFGRQARLAFSEENPRTAGEPLLRMMKIVEEMLAAVRGGKADVNVKLEQLYLFVYRSLVRAKIGDDLASLNEALGVLEYERETWQMACAKHDAAIGVPLETENRTSKSRTDSAPSKPLRIHSKTSNNAPRLSLEA
jgi:flagellar protein FliS